MNITSPTAFARLCGISKQGIFSALDNGLLPFVPDGKKKKIDLDNPDVKAYMDNETRQREVAKQTTSEKSEKKVVKRTTKPKKKIEDRLDRQVASELESMAIAEITKKTKIAELDKKIIQAEILKKNYLPKDFIIDGLFRYIERLNSNLERSSAVFVGEIGNKILEAGEVAPEHIEAFVAIVLEAIHNTKKKILGEIERYEPKL